jgi:kumamolisin
MTAIAAARSYMVRPKIRHHAAGGTFYADEVARIYGFPKVQFKKLTPIACIELGGGYNPADMSAYFSARNLPMPNIIDKSVLGGSNSPGGDADGEVVLDIQIAATVFSYMTGQPATIMTMFAPNTIAGFAGAIQAAVDAGAWPSISWGGAEKQYGSSDIQAMEVPLKASSDAGRPACAAAGDNGASDGETGNNADYPSSSIYAVSCAGTRLVKNPDGTYTESVWNNGANGGATGGGPSALFATPSYQTGFLPTGIRGRCVPDVCGLADPETGFAIFLQNAWQVIGGTSATAPLYAGYFAALASSGINLSNLHSLLYSNESTCFSDIILGSN